MFSHVGIANVLPLPFSLRQFVQIKMECISVTFDIFCCNVITSFYRSVLNKGMIVRIDNTLLIFDIQNCFLTNKSGV